MVRIYSVVVLQIFVYVEMFVVHSLEQRPQQGLCPDMGKYRIFNNRSQMSWNTGQTLCQRFGTDYDLPWPLDRAGFDCLKQELIKRYDNYSQSLTFHLGLSADGNDNDWLWIKSGESVNWQYGETAKPIVTFLMCAAVRVSKGGWEVVNCDESITNVVLICQNRVYLATASPSESLCETLLCSSNGKCSDGQCFCNDGFIGELCDIDVCRPTPCKHGGNCTAIEDNYKCGCTSGWTGRNCSDNVDECASSPCVNNATCRDDVNGYTCNCSAGYTGPRCEDKVNKESETGAIINMDLLVIGLIVGGALLIVFVCSSVIFAVFLCRKQRQVQSYKCMSNRVILEDVKISMQEQASCHSEHPQLPEELHSLINQYEMSPYAVSSYPDSQRYTGHVITSDYAEIPGNNTKPSDEVAARSVRFHNNNKISTSVCEEVLNDLTGSESSILSNDQHIITKPQHDSGSVMTTGTVIYARVNKKQAPGRPQAKEVYDTTSAAANEPVCNTTVVANEPVNNTVCAVKEPVNNTITATNEPIYNTICAVNGLMHNTTSADNEPVYFLERNPVPRDMGGSPHEYESLEGFYKYNIDVDNSVPPPPPCKHTPWNQ